MTTKDRIIALFDAGNILYYSEISQILQVNIEDVVKICNELEEEGKIGDARPEE